MKKELIRATVNREHGMKRERRLSSRRALALVCSIAVLFSSLYISMSPVLADKLICGQKEHTHSSDCYEEILVCGEEERDPEIVVHREFSGDFSWHTHSDSCRNEAGEIVCGQQEGYYHLHNEWCLDENGKVICGLDEIAPHSHDASCYAEDGTLICRKDDVPVLTSSEGNISEWEEVIDEGHTHTDDCYGLADTPSCGMKEHTHTADCYEPEKKEEKEPEKKEEKEPEKKEEKEPEKKESEKNKDQDQEKKDPEKKDEKDPEKKDSDQTEGKEQGKTEESGENGKTDDPAETDPNAAQSDGEKKDGETPEGEGNPDGTPEGQTGGEQNGTGNPDGTGEGTDGNPEGTGEGTDGNPEGTGEGTDGNPEGTGEGTEGNPEGTGEGTDGNPEGTGEENDGNPDGTGEGTGEGTDGNPEGTGDGTENVNPDGTEGDPALNGKTEGAEGKEGLEGTEGKEGTEGAEGAEGTELGTNATDAEGNLIGEDGQVEGEEGLTDEEGENPEGAEEQEPAEPVNYIVGPLVFPGADYTVTANFGVEALFPEGTTLQVREILPGDAEYEQLAAQAESAVVDDEETSVTMMRFFDITFMTEKGEIEPKAPVNIQITYNEVIPDTVDDMVYTLHFAEEGQAPEVLETKTKSVDAAAQVEEAVDTVEFQSGSFSIFVVASVRQNQGGGEGGGGGDDDQSKGVTTTAASFKISWYDTSTGAATAWPVGDSSAETVNITIQKNSGGEGTGPNSLQYTIAGSGTGTLIKIDGRDPTDAERTTYACSCSVETPSNIYTVTVSGLVEGIEYTINQDTIFGYNSPEYDKDNKTIKNYGKKDFAVHVVKIWNDGKSSHTDSVTVYLTGTAGGVTYVETNKSLPYDEQYALEFTDLPYRGGGQIIVYNVTESNLNGYGYSVTKENIEAGLLFTIKNSLLHFSIDGHVIWDLQAPHTLPTSLTLQLKRKEGQSGSWVNFGDPISATPDDWHYHWDNLPQFVDGTTFPREEYIYQLEATNLPDEYTPAVGTENNHYQLKFVYEVVDVKVTTQWNDDGDRDGKRPGTSDYASYLKLYIGDIEVKGATPTVTDNHDNTYTVSFGIKDKKKSGNPIDYKIRENKVPGYNTTSTSKYRIVNVGGTFLNTYRPAQTLITVIKRWNDRLDRDGLRADVVTRIELLKTVDGNTDIADSVTVQTADLVWTKVWSGLPVNEGGKPISYSVREIMINANGYTTDAEEPLRVLNGGKVTITDTHIPAPVVPPSRSSTTNRTGTTGTSTGSSSGSSGGGYYGGGGYSSGTKSSIRNVKVFYWLRKQGGEPAAKTASVNHREGEAFAIYSPQIPGYQTNMTLVSGKMGVRDDVYHVIYKPMDYVLTIEFLDEKGETLAKAVTLQKMHIGDEYSVPVPEIAGYRAGLTLVQGIFTGNQRIRVVYIPDEYGYTVIEDYRIPRSFGAMPVNVGECWE